MGQMTVGAVRLEITWRGLLPRCLPPPPRDRNVAALKAVYPDGLTASRSAATRAPMAGSVHHKMRPFVSMANPPIKSPARTASLSLLLPWSSLPPPPPGEPPPPPEPPLPTSPPPPVQALAVDRRPGLGRCCRYPGLPSAALCDGGATGRLWGGWAKRLGARRAGQRALEAGKLRLAALSVPAPPTSMRAPV